MFYPLLRKFKLFAAVSIIWFCASPAGMQQLAVRSFQTTDGLAHNTVNSIFQDAKGFLWVATSEGLSRFDGYNFINYGAGDGLGHIFVNDVTADRRGRLWAATNGGGVSLLLDEPGANTTTGKKFASFLIAEGRETNTANFVNRMLFDRDNRLWCVTDKGLFRAKETEVADFQFELILSGTQPNPATNAAFTDSRGRLWFGVNNSVVEIAGERQNRYDPVRETASPNKDFAAPHNINSIFEDERGRILAAETRGIYEFVEPADANQPGAWRKLPLPLQRTQGISTVIPAAGGGVWIGGNPGLIHYLDGRQTFYTIKNGLSTDGITCLLTDREGNLWLGTAGGGLNKFANVAVAGYSIAQGLPYLDIYRITEDRDGNIYSQAGCAKQVFFEIAGEKPGVISGSELTRLNCAKSHLLQDAGGRWWFLTDRGLEFSDAPELDLKRGQLIFPFLATNYVQEIFKDTKGDVWFFAAPGNDLYRIDARGGTPHPELTAKETQAEFFFRDSAGSVWLADRNNLWRLRDGKITKIEKIDNLPIIQPRSFFQDSRGSLWIGTRYNGALVTDEPAAENPRFKNYTVADGLASNTIWTIAEDDQNRIYFGTGRGVDQLNDTRNKIRHFTAEDGVTGSFINHLFKDKKGNVWVASNAGVSRIDPRLMRESKQPPPVYISHIRIAGEEIPLSETGVSDLSAADLAANQNNITIQFVGLSFRGERTLRYQYKLEGVDKDWSSPGEQREVTYANLGAGDYRFLVRAINPENVASEQAAAFSFRILPPVWRRWWFVALVALAACALASAIYRYRVSRLLEMEKMRTRIATDLHDDIGANLTRISLLSEVASRRTEDGNGNLLSSIAEIARESVASMNDIVWAISPDHDRLLDLTRRMRGHAEEVFAFRDIELDFRAAAPDLNLKLSVGVRRDVLLIFKEAVNNAARHSECSSVSIDFRLENSLLTLRIADNGKGFNPASETGGQGLRSMTRRAAALSGNLSLDSRQNGGTSVEFKMTLPKRALKDHF